MYGIYSVKCRAAGRIGESKYNEKEKGCSCERCNGSVKNGVKL